MRDIRAAGFFLAGDESGAMRGGAGGGLPQAVEHRSPLAS